MYTHCGSDCVENWRSRKYSISGAVHTSLIIYKKIEDRKENTSLTTCNNYSCLSCGFPRKTCTSPSPLPPHLVPAQIPLQAHLLRLRPSSKVSLGREVMNCVAFDALLERDKGSFHLASIFLHSLRNWFSVGSIHCSLEPADHAHEQDGKMAHCTYIFSHMFFFFLLLDSRRAWSHHREHAFLRRHGFALLLLSVLLLLRSAQRKSPVFKWSFMLNEFNKNLKSILCS